MAKNNRQDGCAAIASALHDAGRSPHVPGADSAITILINPTPVQRNEAWFRAQRQLLRACTPEAVADAWLDEYDHQNALLTECGDEPLWATEFIQCRIEDLMEG